jgi:hypothetical protein
MEILGCDRRPRPCLGRSSEESMRDAMKMEKVLPAVRSFW